MAREELVSVLPGDAPLPPTFPEALKSLEAGVRGYGSPATPQTRALTQRMLGEQERPERPVPLVANKHLQLGWDFEHF